MEFMSWELLSLVLSGVGLGLASAQLCLNTLKVLMLSKSNSLLNYKTKLEIEELEQRKRDALRDAWNAKINIKSS